MIESMVQPKTYDFAEMSRALCRSEHGKRLDSFIRVEYGEEYFRAAWDAFRDVADFFDEQYEGGREMVSQFLMTLEEEVPFAEVGMNPWI
jgi:hypothetical protein